MSLIGTNGLPNLWAVHVIRWVRDGVGAVAFVVIVALAIVSWKSSDALLYPMDPPVPDKPEGRVVEDVEFRSADGIRLSGWYVPPPMCSIPPVCEPAPGLVLSPGRGENRGAFGRELALLHSAGFAILMFDYRGMGLSQNVQSTAGAKEQLDLDAAVDTLRSQRGVRPGPVSVYGKSLGGTIAMLTAADNPNIGAVVEESGFARLSDVMSYNFNMETGLPGFLSPFGVWVAEQRSGSRLSEVNVPATVGQISPRPLVLVHAAGDERVRYEEAQKVFTAAREPKQLVTLPGTSHASTIEADPQVWQTRILGFLKTSAGI